MPDSRFPRDERIRRLLLDVFQGCELSVALQMIVLGNELLTSHAPRMAPIERMAIDEAAVYLLGEAGGDTEKAQLAVISRSARILEALEGLGEVAQ